MIGVMIHRRQVACDLSGSGPSTRVRRAGVASLCGPPSGTALSVSDHDAITRGNHDWVMIHRRQVACDVSGSGQFTRARRAGAASLCRPPPGSPPVSDHDAIMRLS